MTLWQYESEDKGGCDSEKIPAYEAEMTKSWTQTIEQGLFIQACLPKPYK